MPDLLSHVRSLVVPELTRRGVRCVIEAGDHAEAVVYTDPTRLNQIVLNLVTNAVKYTPPGGTVTLGLTHTPKDVTVQVTDTGSGIPADKLDAIFEPFVRLDPAVEGTGLGLAITRELTRVLGGRVEVTNSTAAGSTFTVTIPRWPAAVIPEASGGALAGPRDMPSIPR
jgi:signal transduction histidine kinase